MTTDDDLDVVQESQEHLLENRLRLLVCGAPCHEMVSLRNVGSPNVQSRVVLFDALPSRVDGHESGHATERLPIHIEDEVVRGP